MSSGARFLKSLTIFKNLPDEALSQLARVLKERKYREGERLCREGEVDPWVYFIRSGQCRATKLLGNEEVELRQLTSGDVMGLTSAFRSRARSASLTAATDLEVYALSHKDFNDVLFSVASGTEAIRSLLEHFAASVRRKNKEMAELRRGRVHSGRPRVAVFDSKDYTRVTFLKKGGERYDFQFFDTRLEPKTATLAENARSVVAFVNDDLSKATLETLAGVGVEHIALRCAGFNNVDLGAAKELGLSVTRVPAYSPHAVAEHSLALILALNRKIHKAYGRVREGNFTLDGLVGFDLYGQTVGVVGTGKIGRCMVHILRGLGCRVLCYDVQEHPEILGLDQVEYCGLDKLLRESRIVSLYVPLTRDTFHMIDKAAIEKMQDGVMLINTSRGGLVETKALIEGLKSGKIGSAGLDVYEEESAYFFEDFSEKSIGDDVLARLLTFNNVIVTSHQAFLTEQALSNIASTTLQSIDEFFEGKRSEELTHSVLSLG